MALEKQTVNISLEQGPDTKTDPKQVVAGKLLALENGVFISPKRIKKRNGHTGLGKNIIGGSTSISTGYSVNTFKDELVEADATALYSYAADLDKWVNKGTIINVAESTKPVVRNNYQQTAQDSCYHSIGLQCFVWEDSSAGSRYSIIDTVTGQEMVANALLLSTATVPKCFAIGNYIFISFFDTGTNRLRYYTISITSPTTLSTIADLSVTANTTVCYDGTVIGDRLFFVFNNNTAGINLVYVNAFLSFSSERTIAGEVASATLSLFGDTAQNVWVVYWNATAVKVFIRNYDLTATAVLAPTSVEVIANVTKVTGVYTGTLGQLFYDVSGSPTYNYFTKTSTITVAGTVAGTAVIMRSVGLASKAFYYNSSSYVMVTYESNLQPTYFLINQAGAVMAKVSSGSGGGIPAKKLVPNVNRISTGVYQISYLQKGSVVNATETANIFFLLGVMQTTFDFTQTQSQSVEIGNNLHITSGFLYMYDGANLVEHGFHLFPEQASSSTNGAGGSILAGTYQYKAVYEWTDNYGQVHRSTPSIAVTQITTGSTSTNTVTIPTLRVTAKKSTSNPVVVALYRTQAAGTVFFKVSSITSPTINSTTADTVAIVDTFSDTTIGSNQQLYTTGEIENTASPVPLALCTFKNRVIVVDSENKLDWWYSKQVISNSPVEFTDTFVGTVDSRGGPITVPAPMDDKLIFFKNDDIFYVYGDGPSASGANNDFSQAQLITTGLGCTDPKSVVNTPNGLMFKSRHGIFLLNRSLGTQYIGADVEAYNDSTVTSAHINKKTNEVRFTLDSGVILNFDYFRGQWSVFTGLDGVDSCIFQNNFTFVQSDGLVMQEAPGTYTDNTAFIKLKLVTSWLSLSQLQGFQRVKKLVLLGEYISPHRLIVSVASNFNTNITQQVYVDASDLATGVYGSDSTYGLTTPFGGNFPSYQFGISLVQQKTESIQITIEDTQSSDFGEGYNISALAFEVGVKRGSFKLPDSQTFG